LNQKNSTVAVAKHGDPVTVVDVRRRYVRVRTAKGAVGWMDASDLLTPNDMQRIKQERQRALSLPSEGSATAYESLNIHLAPNRKSPAFAQIPEGGSVTILARTVSPKSGPLQQTPTFTPERAQQPVRKPRKEKSKPGFKLPPLPPPPKPPANWVALSTGDEAESVEKTPITAKPNELLPAKPEVVESWNLVRTRSNEVGWVLSRNLMMSIPDEVAQYAEGKHITSFFSLGAVNDEEKGPKQNWLWTTVAGTETFDFDSWRVFLWNRRRHRYETSYRKRDLEGYFPVEIESPDATAFGRSFKMITRDDDGKFRRRTYLFDGTLVHLRGTEDYSFTRSTSGPALNGSGAAVLPTAKGPRENWLKRKWNELSQRFSKAG
jgi:hypothetical protein